jgi:hypothetical protein
VRIPAIEHFEQDVIYLFGWTERLSGRPISAIEMGRRPDWIKFILGRPMSSAPGDVFNDNRDFDELMQLKDQIVQDDLLVCAQKLEICC